MESEILDLGTKGKRLLLVDNVDALLSSGKKGSAATLTLSSTSFTSALLHVIDTGNVFVVATCTNAQDVDAGLLQPYRLGSPLVLKLPPKTHREQIITTILSDPTVTLAHDTLYEGVNAVSKELALRTQGLSACDLWKIMREQYQRAAQDSANAWGDKSTSVLLSTQQLFQAVSLAATSAQTNAQKDDASKFVRPVDYDAPAPVLFGVEAVQQQLLQCIGTIVPELAKESATSSALRTRKCSGKFFVACHFIPLRRRRNGILIYHRLRDGALPCLL
jgi:SpoVK/Ycf46/Vps4 family AAA+-type ATPase